jgi:long-subunit acyl-CoA synthetase (AMP-forming)
VWTDPAVLDGVQQSDILSLVYTSGTTGTKKKESS